MHKLLSKEYLNDNTFKVFFEKKGLTFLPGQHFSISIPNKSINREYSSYTSPHDSHLGFLIRRVEGGIMTNILNEMNIGDEVNIYGPYGSFTISEKQIFNKQIIFIASGTGIAPFVSLKETYEIKKYKLFLGVRSRKDIPDPEKFDQSKSYYCISREDNLRQNNYFKGRITDNLDKLDFIEGFKTATYMLCGNSFMISDVYDMLVNEKGIDPNNIISESFF